MLLHAQETAVPSDLCFKAITSLHLQVKHVIELTTNLSINGLTGGEKPIAQTQTDRSTN